MSLDLGFKGVELQPGEHLCGLYAGARQRDEIMLPYLRAGLEAGEKCICIVDSMEPSEVIAALGPLGTESTRPGVKRLDVIRAADAYLRSGTFSAAEIMSVWKAAISEVMYLGQFAALRSAHLMVLREVVPDMAELLRLEAELRHYLPMYPQVALCLYDVDRFGSEIIADVIRLHSKAIIGGTIVENPVHLTADELLALQQRSSVG